LLFAGLFYNSLNCVMQKIIVGFFIFLMMNIVCIGQTKIVYNYKPANGYVPNKETAIKIAEALWLQVYGEKINDKKPFIAELKDGKIWIVKGTLHHAKGGVPYIEIRKSDCKILRMTHGK